MKPLSGPPIPQGCPLSGKPNVSCRGVTRDEAGFPHTVRGPDGASHGSRRSTKGSSGNFSRSRGSHARREKGSSLQLASFPVQVAGCSLTLKTAPSI